ncbi:GDNF family receptor alpha-2-like [Cyprinodon tularosa]|uniref:GDNF family receptor alpha-2-like n=1 Tax=Cyprinodon tularosa TaxID=77115 RepID=UPI0018E1E5ED|nr:GDNF family receptor alpha-2-like [Cyprinodon tularosa]
MKSGTLRMRVCIFLVLIGSLEGSSAFIAPMANISLGFPSTRSAREAQSQWVDCIQASELCTNDPHCSPWYRVMRQCLVGKEKDAMLDNNRDCKTAVEVLHKSSLYYCRCKRAMKNELQCLQNYWTIHMGLNEGGDMEDSSPYEPVAPNRQPDVFGLASISSGMHTLNPKPFQCPEGEKVCNPCLDATKACNLNGICKRHRSSYITTCSKDTNKGESCNKKRCHKTLRAFLDRVPSGLSQRLIFCPCQSEGCAERRRQTIVPDCSYVDKVKPNCLELRAVCRADPLCRSRLADYMTNCWMAPNTVGTCPNQDNHQACLNSYARLIGTEMTPNYVDNSFTNWTISPWCDCMGSGNQEEECMNFLRYFTDNTCLSKSL